MANQTGEIRPKRVFLVAGIILSVLIALMLFVLLSDRTDSSEDEIAIDAAARTGSRQDEDPISALETANHSEDQAAINILVMVPMAWFDDIEVDSVRRQLSAFPKVALTFAGPRKGHATSHEGHADLDTDLAFEDVDASLYDAFIVHGACTHHHFGKPPAPIDYAQMDRILTEADAAGKVIAAVWEGVPAIHHANLLEGRSVTKTLQGPGPESETRVMLPSSGDGPQSTLILADSIAGNPHFVYSILVALGLKEE